MTKTTKANGNGNGAARNGHGKTADELTRDAIALLDVAIRRIYADENPQLTIRMMDARASKLRHAIESLSAGQL